MSPTDHPGEDHTAAAALDVPLRMVAFAALATLLCIAALWILVSPARAVSPGGVAWTRYVHGPGTSTDDLEAVATDAAGSGYFAATIGTATHGTDVRLLKVTASNKQAWALRWDSPAHKNDTAVTVVVDKAAARVYVGGITTDKAGHVRVFVLAATTGGKRLWSQIRPAPSGFQADWVNGIGLDGKGNIYLGASLDKLSTGDAGRAFVVKYARSGRWLWAASFRPSSADFSASGFAVSRAGSVAISGVSVSGGAYKDAWTALLSSSGRVKWARGYDGPAHLTDSAAAVAFGPRGSVYVTGFTQVASPTRDAALFQKYSSGGTPLWTQVLTPGVSDAFSLHQIAVDPAGNVYADGYGESSVPSGTTGSILTASLTSNGTLRWMATNIQSDRTAAEAESILLAGGRLYVGGKATTGPNPPASQQRIGKVISYNPANGVSDWIAQFNGAGAWGVCWVDSLAAGKAGVLYVAGSAQRPFGDPSMSWDGFALRVVR